MKLSLKIVLVTLITSITVMSITVTFITRSFTSDLNKKQEENISLTGKQITENIQTFLNKFLAKTLSLSQVLKISNEIPIDVRRDVVVNQLRANIEADESIKAIWSIWEPNAIDANDSLYEGTMFSTHTGSFAPSFYRSNNQILSEIPTTPQYEEDFYKIPKTTQNPTLLDPYYYSYTNRENEKILETSVCIPIKKNDETLGVVGVDIEISELEKVCTSLKISSESSSFVVSKAGTIILHSNKQLVSNSFQKYLNIGKDSMQLINKLKTDTCTTFEYTNDKGVNFVYYLHPIKFENTKPWIFVIEIPINQLHSQNSENVWIIVIIGLCGVILTVLIGFRIASYVVSPLKKVIKILNNLAHGDIDSCEKMDVHSHDEIGQIRHSVNSLLDTLKKTTEFARAIGEHNLNKDFNLLSENDVLGNALMQMQKSLIKAEQEEETRKEQDNRYNWATQGLAKFAEILRQNFDDINEFGYSVISNLVKYLNSNQGGIYIVHDENTQDVSLQMISSYAYNRRKFLERTIEAGVGLVGRCYQEAETIYITDLPKNYLQISSGLGEENPKHLLIVPIKSNELVVGVVELAAFEPIEKYKIDFVEKVGESIAAAITTVRINLKTAKLLEESKMQREKLSSQEEEMRQNIEELQATQEESIRNQHIAEDNLQMIKNLVDVFPHPAYIKDHRKCYVLVNRAMCELFNISFDDFIGQSDNEILSNAGNMQTIHDLDAKALEEKIPVRQRQKIDVGNGKNLVLDTHKLAFTSQLTGFTYILGVSIDITDKVNVEKNYKKQIEVLVNSHDYSALVEVGLRKHLAEVLKSTENEITNTEEMPEKDQPS